MGLTFRCRRRRDYRVKRRLCSPRAFNLIHSFCSAHAWSCVSDVRRMASLIFFTVMGITMARICFLPTIVSGPICYLFMFRVRFPMSNGIISCSIKSSASNCLFFFFYIQARGTIGNVVRYAISTRCCSNTVAVINRGTNRSFCQSRALKLRVIM